jgi:hypothetical protein
MPGQQELQVQQKREVEKAQEATRPMRAFLPTTDIFETEDALTLVSALGFWLRPALLLGPGWLHSGDHKKSYRLRCPPWIGSRA